MKTGAAYIRVSTEEQAEYSPDSQLKQIKAYAKQHQIEIPPSCIFTDEGISGRTARARPQFLRMIAAAREQPKPFEVILLWKFSRFARNRQDSILYKSMLRKECGIDVISITEPLSDDPTSILIEALLEAMDEYYSLNLAEEVKRGMNERFSRGGAICAPPFGYRMGAEGFEIAEEEAAWIRLIFNRFAEGASPASIAALLNREGVRTKRGGLFEPRSIRYFLANPVYSGYLRRLDPEIAAVKMAGYPTPIISEALFSQVQERLSMDKKAAPGQRQTNGAANFMLKGLVRCSACGSTLTRTAGGRALQCCSYTRGQCRESHYITLSVLNEAVLLQLQRDLEGCFFPLFELLSSPVLREQTKNRILASVLQEICYFRQKNQLQLFYRPILSQTGPPY